MDKTSLGDRMKSYEHVTRTKLMPRTPVIIRVDGKAFHTWTKWLRYVDDSMKTQPFSNLMHDCMVNTAFRMVHNTQNAVLAYTQSDEISILLNDWKTFTTNQWFGGGLQKIASVSASMATAYFNATYRINSGDDKRSAALFDARVFNIPKEEVVNYFIWRQQDASRNSVQMLGRHYFSHKEMHKKNVQEINDMLYTEKGVMWNQLDDWKKRGSCVTRTPMINANITGVSIDNDIPLFTEYREYIEDLLEADNV